jgi:acyl-coenzyme A thioesterase PaaI-like protein
MPVLGAVELSKFIHEAFPQAHPERFVIDIVTDGALRLRYEATADDLRPGDTVSGPTLMALSDRAMYLAVLAMIGPVALAVTTSLNINFLRKPRAGELIVDARQLSGSSATLPTCGSGMSSDRYGPWAWPAWMK